MTIFDGYDFDGPVGIDSLPGSSGVYIITTQASGGIKILGVYAAKDMHQSSIDNPKRTCWQKNRKDTDPEAYFILTDDDVIKSRICDSIITRRYYRIECNDPIKDDF